MSRYFEELSVPDNVATIIGAMSIVQLIKHAQKTFGNIANSTFNTMMGEATSAKRTDMVFDIYQNNSMKNIEQVENRSAATVL